MHNHQSPSSAAPSGAKSLDTVLQQQHSRLQTLHDLLLQELEALKDRQVEQLSELLPRKLDQLEAIQLADQQIQPHHQQLKAEYQPQIDEILTLQEACQRQNKVNGELLNLQQSSLNRLQSVLTASRGSSVTYDQDGRTQGNSSLGTDIKA